MKSTTVKHCSTTECGVSCHLRWVGVCWKCVSHRLVPINLSRQDFSLNSFRLEPETTDWVLCQVFILLAVFTHTHSQTHSLPCVLLQVSVCFITFLLSFSLIFFHLFPSPGFGPCLPLFLPHFLCALQWFFRFFPNYDSPPPPVPSISRFFFFLSDLLPYRNTDLYRAVIDSV